MGLFKRPSKPQGRQYGQYPAQEEKLSKYPSPENPSDKHVLPTYEENGRLVTKGINPEGESGRSGIHPFHFFRIAFRSATKVNMILNILWPFVPAAMVLNWTRPEWHVPIFACSYIGMVPAASLLGFAGQEFARKLPRVVGILIETILGGVVEIVLFMILIVKHKHEDDRAATANEAGEEYETTNFVPVIQAAILGSILANLLLCLGACFLIGGIKYKEQSFHGVVSEVGSGLLLVAGFALLIPSAFFSALNGHFDTGYTAELLQHDTLKISQGTSCILIFSFLLYVIYSAISHDSIFDEALAHDEAIDRDREKDLAKSKFTLCESIIAIVIALTCISLLAFFLVSQIEPLVRDEHVKDNFMGLILVPLVEKIAEHLTAVDEAYDNQINFALFHCLGPSIQTALFNAPLVVLVGWGLRAGYKTDTPMSLNFEIFMIVLLVLSILVVGNFLRDGSSNWLEGALLVIVYVIVALTAWYYPNGKTATTNGVSASTEKAAIALAKRMIESGMLPKEL